MQVEKRWKGDLEENNLKEAKIGGIIEKTQKPLKLKQIKSRQNKISQNMLTGIQIPSQKHLKKLAATRGSQNQPAFE